MVDVVYNLVRMLALELFNYSLQVGNESEPQKIVEL